MLVLLVILGIGFLIFVHELGHFVVAKMVGIRVLAFSVGFGPKVVGFRRGETEYRLSLFPLGGYVKMAGESPDDGEIADERDFRAKTVGERAAVISAGVVMNAIFGFLIFVVAFFLGVPFDVPEVGAVRPGGPAWEAGVPVGARILAVNGNKVFDFADVSTETALSRRSSGAVLTLQTGDGEPFDVRVDLHKNATNGYYEIGIFPPLGPVELGSATPGGPDSLRDGDVLLSVEGEDLDPVELERFLASHSISDPSDPEQRFLRFSVLRDGHRLDVKYEPRWVGRYRIGIRPVANRVLGIRSSVRSETIDLRRDDIVQRIAGRAILSDDDFASAMRGLRVGEDVEVEILRDGKEVRPVWRFHDAASKDEFVADVALGDDRESNVIRVIDGEPAVEAGVLDGDRIESVDGRATRSFDDILEVMQGYAGGSPVEVRLRRSGEPLSLRIQPREFFYPERFGIRHKVETLRVGSLSGAVAVGFQRTIYTAKLVYVMLDRMLFRRTVSTKNIGGILTISYVSWKFAETGLAKLLYFLALLSINLAIINLLPIPILDGGQLVFLLIEKVKGSPVNEKVMQYAQIVGVALLVLLVIYVTYNDIERLFLLR